MPRTCTVCTHPDREAIDREIVERVPSRTIASRYQLDRSAILRHKDAHVSASLVRVVERRDARAAETLADRVESLYVRASAILDRAESDHVALGAIRELRGVIELLGKITGEISSAPTTNVISIVGSEDWWHLRDRLLASLPDDPNARAAVVGRL